MAFAETIVLHLSHVLYGPIIIDHCHIANGYGVAQCYAYVKHGMCFAQGDC